MTVLLLAVGFLAGYLFHRAVKKCPPVPPGNVRGRFIIGPVADKERKSK
jgi:hypothetical protein